MSRSTLRWAVIILTLITALIHLALGIGGVLGQPDALSVLFILNGLGYLALLAAVFLSVPFFATRRALAHYLLMLFAAVTFVAFFALNFSRLGQQGPMAIIAKVDELLLIIAAYLHLRVSA